MMCVFVDVVDVVSSVHPVAGQIVRVRGPTVQLGTLNEVGLLPVYYDERSNTFLDNANGYPFDCRGADANVIVGSPLQPGGRLFFVLRILDVTPDAEDMSSPSLNQGNVITLKRFMYRSGGWANPRLDDSNIVNPPEEVMDLQFRVSTISSEMGQKPHIQRGTLHSRHASIGEEAQARVRFANTTVKESETYGKFHVEHVGMKRWDNCQWKDFNRYAMTMEQGVKTFSTSSRNPKLAIRRLPRLKESLLESQPNLSRRRDGMTGRNSNSNISYTYTTLSRLSI
jgi:hypothetical protein